MAVLVPVESGDAVEQLLIVLVTLFFPPILCLVAIVIVLAIFGKSLGIRRAYVQLLLHIFEWGKQRLERARREELGADSPSTAVFPEKDEVNGNLLPSSPEGARSRSESGGTTTIPSLIDREATKRIVKKMGEIERLDNRVWTMVDDSLDFIKSGMEAIMEDDVTSRFSAEELASWNLLTRTSGYGFTFMGWRLTLLWAFGCFLRYAVLFPARLILLFIGIGYLIICTAAIGYLNDGPENMAKTGGICVANHTSPIDVMILACDNCYALVGQCHGGLLGVIQRALNRASSHIWFERAEAKDRFAVLNRLRDHVQHPEKLPILIFPEGTCINNTSVMMFKKGSFEVGGTVYPVAIKYDPRFGDPFWNSSRQSWFHYLVMMMTSWAIVCHVYYLPPMSMQEGEDGVAFANRGKKAIAEAGGLVDLDWDGQLKRYPVSAKMIDRNRALYSRRLDPANADDFGL